MDIFSRKYRSIFVLLLWVLLLPLCSESAAVTQVESKVKAAFVVNFARFISWPEESFELQTDPLVICTVGISEDEVAFTGIENKKIKGHPIALRTITSLDEPTDSCQRHCSGDVDVLWVHRRAFSRSALEKNSGLSLCIDPV